MSHPETLTIYGDYLKPRELQTVLTALDRGGVILLPTDTGYSLLCRLGDKSAAQKIRQIKTLNKDHPFAILCADLSALAAFTKVDNVQYRLLKQLLPGLYTCILPASKEAPRLVQHEKRKTIGIRVSENAILQTVLQAHGAALMGVSAFDSAEPIADPAELAKSFVGGVDLIVDAGERPNLPSTVLDLTAMPPEIIRAGAGDISILN